MSQKRRRITAKRKQEIVLRMLRGEALDILSREFDIPAEKLTRWREAFIKGGMENLKTKPGSVQEKENRMLKEKVGEMTMEGIERSISLRLDCAQSQRGRRNSKHDFGLNGKTIWCSAGVSGVENLQSHFLPSKGKSEASASSELISSLLRRGVGGADQVHLQRQPFHV